MTINQLPELAQAELEARRRAAESDSATEEPTASAPVEAAEPLLSDQDEDVRRDDNLRVQTERQEQLETRTEQQALREDARRAERTEEAEQQRLRREENREQIVRELNERQDERRQEEERRDERLETLREEREALRERRLALQEEDRLQAEERLENRRDNQRLRAEQEATDELRNEQAIQQPLTDDLDQAAGDPSRRNALTDDEEALASRMNFDQTTDLNAPEENLEGAAPVQQNNAVEDATENAQSTAVGTLEDVATVDPYADDDIADTLQLLRAEVDILREMLDITAVDDPALQSELEEAEQQLEDETEREANRLQTAQGSTDRLGNFIDAVS